MLKRKRIVLSLMLIVVMFLVACGNNKTVSNKVEKSDINVTVKDKVGQNISATVNLFNTNKKLIDSKKGKTVSFKDLNCGSYIVKATLDNSTEIPSEVVIADKEEVALTLQFNTFSSVKSINKKIFAAEDTKKITIKDLKEGEKVILGVSPFVFDPTDETTYTAEVYVDKSDLKDTNNNIVISPLNKRNPEYIYNPAPKVDLPKIRSLDSKLRKIEGELFSQKLKDEIPVFNANDYTLGDIVPLWVGDPGEMNQINTVVEGIGENCAIIVDENVNFLTEEELNKYVDQYINEFDNHIFSNNTGFYNDEFDLDQNGKLTIAFIDMGGVSDGAITMGYFSGKDFYTQAELNEFGYEGVLYSNERDIVYINIRALKEGWNTRDHFSTIGHEFQHLLWYYNCWEKDAWYDDSWVNEGMSTYSEQINGYQVVDGRIYCYFDNGYVQLQDSAEVSLLHWTQKLADYGISNLFTNYIAEQFGEGILHAIYSDINDTTSPVDVIENYAGMEFEDIFMNFIIANKLHSLNLAPEYTYDLPLEGDPTHTPINPNYSGSTPVLRPSGVKYFEVTGTGTDVTLEIGGTVAEETVGSFIYRY